MKLHTKILAVLLSIMAGSSFADVDNNAKSAGTTTGRNMTGSSFEAAANPALLGVDRAPTGGLLIPFTNFGAALWSDKLAINWLDNNFTSDPHERAKQLSRLLANSFNITDADNADTTGVRVSDKITKGFKGGLKLYAGARTSLLSAANGRIGIDVTTHADEQLTIPEGPLYMLFSNDKGLLKGNTLDFSKFDQQGIWATDVTFSMGLPVTIPALHEFFGLRYGAGGIGVKYVMGHSILQAKTLKGSVAYKTAENRIAVDGEIQVQTAGDIAHGNMMFDNPFKNGLPVNGHGIGLDLGGILYDDNATLSINFQNLGVLIWINNTKKATYKIHKNNLDFYDIVNGFKVGDYNTTKSGLAIFNRDSNEYLSDARDSLHESDGFVTTLPMAINIGYAYMWNFKERQLPPALQPLKSIAKYATGAANYQQQLAGGPGRSYLPRLSLGSELGAAGGYLPLRLGLVLGGPEEFASALGFGINFNYASLQFSYKAIGHLFFVPVHGMELAGALNVNWGMKAPEHAKPFVPPPPRHDTLVTRIRDTLIRKDTIIVKDTVKIRDTIIQIKMKPTEKEEKALSKELKGVNFQTASAELTSDSYSHLTLIADFLKKYRYLKYEIQGHTDSRGDATYNLLLSAARAASVRNFLLGQGIPDSSIIAIGYGKTKPIAPNTTAAGRALNRRVQFNVIDTDENYKKLKVLEVNFQEQIRSAQIKGAPAVSPTAPAPASNPFRY
jgi:outer membrane protein OmpA-like peptidoglycan-associated protein